MNLRRRNVIRKQRSRRGAVALEEVMILAVMLPLTAAAYFVSAKICRAVYDVLSVLVAWPFL